MKESIDPDIEFNWGPTLWAAGTVILFGLVGNVLIGRPQLLGHGAVVAGIVTSFQSGYYQNTGHNAAVGTLLGIVLLTPALAYSRAVSVFGIEGTGDTLFISVALGLAWVIIAVIILLPLAYIGSIVGDFTRKQLGGSLGY